MSQDLEASEPGMSAEAREAPSEYSKAGGASADAGALGPVSRTALFAITLAGSLLLVIADFSTLLEVRVGMTVPTRETSGSHHGYALVVIALAAAVFAYGAWRRGSQPALVAVLALGLIALAIALAVDLPDTNRTGLTSAFENASASPGAGFYEETLGAVLIVLGGGLGVLAAFRRPELRREREPER